MAQVGGYPGGGGGFPGMNGGTSFQPSMWGSSVNPQTGAVMGNQTQPTLYTDPSTGITVKGRPGTNGLTLKGVSAQNAQRIPDLMAQLTQQQQFGAPGSPMSANFQPGTTPSMTSSPYPGAGGQYGQQPYPGGVGGQGQGQNPYAMYGQAHKGRADSGGCCVVS